MWRYLLTMAAMASGALFAAEESEDLLALHNKTYLVRPAFDALDEKRLPPAPWLNDLPGFLKSKGIILPPDGGAAFDRETLTATVHAPKIVLEQIDDFLRTQPVPAALRVVFTLVEFSVRDPADLADLSYEALRKAAGRSWRIIDLCAVQSLNGRRTSSRLVRATSREKGEKDEHGNFAPNEYGAVAEIESQYRETGVCDISVAYHYRTRGSAETAPLTLEAETNVMLQPAVPFILQVVTAEGPASPQASVPAKQLAVIATAAFTDANGRPFPKQMRLIDPAKFLDPFR